VADLRRDAALTLAYLVVGIGIYARILPTYFVADDFAFLELVASAASPDVILAPLAGRYFRPGVVAVYYLNYLLAGLSPWPYHLTVVLINVVNAWLVFQLGRTLSPDRAVMVPALAGLLFLVFGGHAEAVTWIGGMADPLVTMFVLIALVLFLRSLDCEKPHSLLIGCWVAFAAALLAKESAAAFGGLALVCALLRAPGLPDRTVVRRVVIALSVPALLLAGYFVLRERVLGFPFVTLEGLGTSPNLLKTTRAFILRSFLPQGPLFMAVWYRFLDVAVLLPIVLGFGWRIRRSDYRGLILLALCFTIALLPVLPLSIGVITPESERLIYMATAFSCLLVVWFLDRAVRHRWLLVTIVLVLCVGHVIALDRINRNWQEASTVVHDALSTLARTLRDRGTAAPSIYALNLPDNVRGAFVFRRGFHEGLRLTAPDQGAAIARTHVVSVQAITDVAERVQVERRGDRTVRVDVGSGRLIGGPAAPTAAYTMPDWTPRSFAIEFTTLADGSLVVYFTPREAAVVGTLPLSQ
jgi:protein O-mannosyl-transferase